MVTSSVHCSDEVEYLPHRSEEVVVFHCLFVVSLFLLVAFRNDEDINM